MPDPTPVRLGLWGAFDSEDLGPALWAQVVRAELARRLPDAHIRVLAPTGRPTRAARGELVEAVPDLSAVSEELDFVVEMEAGVGPPPAMLAGRLFPAEVLDKRLEYLRLMGWFPARGSAIVVEGEVTTDVDQLVADRPGTTLVVAGRDLPAFVSHEDVVAALRAADGLVSSSPAWCAAALGCGTASVEPGPGLADRLDEAVKDLADGGLLRRAQDEVDAWLDGVASEAVAAARTRHPEGWPDPSRTALLSELRALRRAYRARCERGHLERVLLADRAVRTDAELADLRTELDLLRREMEALTARGDREAAARAAAEAEIAAIHRTRTFRWTASARSVYRFLRRR